MNHEEKKEKSHPHRSFDATSNTVCCDSDSKYFKVQSCYYSLRDRVFDMLGNGTSIVTILKEINNDKFCNKTQKSCI